MSNGIKSKRHFSNVKGDLKDKVGSASALLRYVMGKHGLEERNDLPLPHHPKRILRSQSL